MVMVRTCFGFGAAMLIHHVFVIHAVMLHVCVIHGAMIHLLASRLILRLICMLATGGLGRSRLGSMLFVLAVPLTCQRNRCVQGSQ
ncbi:conserved protein of unknown function [Ectopseudomonas oleovorans]|uniref:Uncharacterized protein n=1 Tax=Ectopseudomonas oleovorans TaxID=301 RepID=A0A653BC15_ECTOL|nr:conserved protein of unknown function [Pseudomonas oleovorans]